MTNPTRKPSRDAGYPRSPWRKEPGQWLHEPSGIVLQRVEKTGGPLDGWWEIVLPTGECVMDSRLSTAKEFVEAMRRA